MVNANDNAMPSSQIGYVCNTFFQMRADGANFVAEKAEEEGNFIFIYRQQKFS